MMNSQIATSMEELPAQPAMILEALQQQKTLKNFRVQAKKLFLTYPQCSTSKEQIQENLAEMQLPHLEWSLIAEEKHKSGVPHIHIGLGFSEKIHYSGEKGHKLLRSLVKSDLLPMGKPGNFVAMRSFLASMGYLIKEGNYLARGIDPQEVLNGKKKDSEFKLAITEMVAGKSAAQIMEEYPATYALRRKNILDFQFDLEMSKKCRPSTRPLLKISLKDPLDRSGCVDALVTWLNENVIEGKRSNRLFKQGQLWLWGPSNIGKSTMLNNLMEGLRCYHIPSKDFYCEWDDKAYDIAVLDEYTGCKTIGWLNQWLEGAKLPLDQKHKPNYIKKFNIPTIICSNLSPVQCYSKVAEVQHQALQNRLQVVFVSDLIQLNYHWDESN